MASRNGRRHSRTRLTPRGRVVVVAFVLIPVALLVRWQATTGGAEGTPAAATTGSPQGSGLPPSSTMPTSSATPTPSSSVAGLPACSVSDVETLDADYDDWAKTIVDTAYRLPDGYHPPHLVSLRDAGFDQDLEIRSVVVDDLADLREAAASAGHPIAVVAAYRSYSLQADLFSRRVQHLGYAAAIAKTARPGHSEHQLGTTLDFKTLGAAAVSTSWGASPTGLWVAANAYRFGFVMSYPEGATARTCYAYEPWHFRYFGRSLAEEIHDSGLTPREFLWQEDHDDTGAGG